jgi:hypothetical protein
MVFISWFWSIALWILLRLLNKLKLTSRSSQKLAEKIIETLTKKYAGKGADVCLLDIPNLRMFTDDDSFRCGSNETLKDPREYY